MINQPIEGFTKDQIDMGAWTDIAAEFCPSFEGEYTFILCGGFGCRHWVQIV
jgi:hypothetical protein